VATEWDFKYFVPKVRGISLGFAILDFYWLVHALSLYIYIVAHQECISIPTNNRRPRATQQARLPERFSGEQDMQKA
jgi:hypothetical protein